MVLTTVIRLLCLIVIKDQLTAHPMSSAFVMALRFDWLILSFLLIPVWLLLVIREFSNIAAIKIDVGIVYYWRIITGTALIIWIVNGLYFTHQKSWMWMTQWKNRLSDESLVSLLLVLGLFSILYLLRNSRLFFWNIRLTPRPSTKAPRFGDGKVFLESVGVVMISALLIALGARGTLTPHHLELQHSKLTSSKEINAWILSPLWTINKKP
ncbi:MAG: hypothetical protein V4736_09120 [Bdellovibrionota bacterium]